MIDKKKIKGFFRDEELWEREWQDMPEFIQEDLMPFKSLIVHFKDDNDLKQFLKLIDQKITKKTKYIWFPKLNSEEIFKLRYADRVLKKRKRNES